MIVPPFLPHPLLAGSHRMTIAAAFWPRSVNRLQRATAKRVIAVTNEVSVVVLVDEPERPPRATLLLAHGLTGSAESRYMVGTAEKALALGFRTARLNFRGCGGTERLAPTLYHSGLSTDVDRVAGDLLRAFGGPLCIAGFSLGGNVVMKLAGEWGRSVPGGVLAVAAVSAPLDLAASAAAIDGGGMNRFYQRSFVSRLESDLRAREACWPGRFDLVRLRGVRSIRAFDDAYTAPQFGFASAADYYRRSSAAPLLGGVRVPTLLVTARDDSFISADACEASDVRENPAITTLIENFGGHLGFIGTRPAGAGCPDADLDRHWAENRVLRFFSAILGAGDPSAVEPLDRGAIA